MFSEVRQLVGPDIDLEIMQYDPHPAEPDLGLYPLLSDIIRDIDPDSIPMKMLLPGVTDARFFARVGIQTYGFTPMNLSQDFDFFSTIHAADERIPVDALHFGTNALRKVIEQYSEDRIQD